TFAAGDRLMSLELPTFFPCRHFPEPDCPVGPSCGQRLAVRRQGHRVHLMSCVPKATNLLSPGNVPEAEDPVRLKQQGPPVGSERPPPRRWRQGNRVPAGTQSGGGACPWPFPTHGTWNT